MADLKKSATLLPKKQADRIKNLLISGNQSIKDSRVCANQMNGELSPNKSVTRNLFAKNNTFLSDQRDLKLLTCTLKRSR